MTEPRQPLKVLQQWTTVCIEEGRNLTEWDREFLDSISDQLHSQGSLSEKQEQILKRIYDAKTP